MHRRRFVSGIAAGAASLSFSMSGHSAQRRFLMPDEAARHAGTWMAFGASARVWGSDLLPRVREDLATIANTLVAHEPVTMLVRPGERDVARELLDARVAVASAPLDDLWMRDTGPVFVHDGAGGLAALDFNFNGWGEKQAYEHDAEVAARVARLADVPRVPTSLVLEGGCIEVDGAGTAIITESCVLNDNRNPGWSKADFEAELKPLLGLEHIIWLPGLRGQDITDGHTDFYARFAHPGVVVAGLEPDPESPDYAVTREHLALLRAARDARGRPLDVVVLEGPTRLREDWLTDDFAAGYIGYYVCNGAVLVQTFGDSRTDGAAQDTLARLFPDRVIHAIDLDGIAAGGGSVHCATQQQPA